MLCNSHVQLAAVTLVYEQVTTTCHLYLAFSAGSLFIGLWIGMIDPEYSTAIP